MSEATLWIDNTNDTATIAGTNVRYTMPLWVFDVMRDIIGAEAEKKVEVTHHDFDTQQELLDRYKAENAELRELAARALGLFLKHGAVHPCDLSEVDAIMDESRELGIEVES